MRYALLGILVMSLIGCSQDTPSSKADTTYDLDSLRENYRISCTDATTFEEMMISVRSKGPQIKIESQTDSVLNSSQITSINKGFYELQGKPDSDLFIVFGCLDDKLIVDLSKKGEYNIWISFSEFPKKNNVSRVFAIRDNSVLMYVELTTSGGQY